MIAYYWTFFCAFAVSVIATPLAREIARKLGVVDHPDGLRKIHRVPIPMAGGYAILLAFVVPLAWIFYTSPAGSVIPPKASGKITVLLSGALVALVMGALDDIYDLRPRWKILGQTVAASVVYFGGVRISGISNPFGGRIVLGLFSFPVTVFWFLGCMNAINLLDGLDGLAAGVAFFAVLTGVIVAVGSGNVVAVILCLCLLGAIAGFLVYNFNPASVFLGDAGSMLLGFMVAALGLFGSSKAGTTVGLLIPFLALGLPVFDTAVSILRRWSERAPVAVADKGHVHHVLLRMGMSQRTAVLVLYGICILFGCTALAATSNHNSLVALALLVVGVSTVISARAFGLVDVHRIISRISDDRDEGRRRTAATIATQEALERMQTADSIEALWTCAFEAFERLELDDASLNLGVDGDTTEFTWRNPDPLMTTSETATALLDEWSISLKLAQEHQSLGDLKVSRTGPTRPIRDAYMLIDRLRYGFSARLRLLLEQSLPAAASQVGSRTKVTGEGNADVA